MQNETSQGICAILQGHSADVNAVHFLANGSPDSQILLSGAADQKILVWGKQNSSNAFRRVEVLDAHTASVNCISCLPGTLSFASGAADGTVKIWTFANGSSSPEAKLIQSINLQPKYFPLALSWHSLDLGSSVLVVGGTRSTIQLYKNENVQSDFTLAATLTGHEGWIRCLDIRAESSNQGSDLLIASASQDKYIRLWRVHQGADLPNLALQDDGDRLGTVVKSLSSKAQRFEVAGLSYIVSFEALLLGHEDWVYTAHWDKSSPKPRLLSASADSSLSLWEPESTSGVWICQTRLGEISIQKGSTTATGSAGGFYLGLWLDGGKAVTCLGRTGSWRKWSQHAQDSPWKAELGISGHIKDVKGIAWAKNGEYLLSTSTDQTTRVHAEWKRGTQRTWHEFARPQIHGYDLNCIDSISSHQFVSGADEKLLRVFDEPSLTGALLHNLSRLERLFESQPHEAASIPVLGLSNKAVQVTDSYDDERDGDITQRELAAPTVPVLATDHPPYEDDLARHTLWPEREKLYGHGYEISAVAASQSGKIIATACKASAIDHAVIRIYETKTWREIPNPLKAHSLTVTCLRFSDDDRFLLSVGRDRQWTVFSRDAVDEQTYSMYASNPKGHLRMILGAAWASVNDKTEAIFATAGRDKSIKVWSSGDATSFECRVTIQCEAPVMTVDFLPQSSNDLLLLASGTETGVVTLSSISINTWSCVSSCSLHQR